MAFSAYEVCRVVVLSVTRQTSHANDFVSAESHASEKPLFAGYAFLNRNNSGLNQKEVGCHITIRNLACVVSNARKTVLTRTRRRGGSRIFFRRGCTRLLLYFNTNKPHIFFWQNTSCIRKPRVISGGEGGAHPLHPPPRSAPEERSLDSTTYAISIFENCTAFA